MSSTQRYGDIQKSADLSAQVQETMRFRYANSSAYSDYNQIRQAIVDGIL